MTGRRPAVLAAAAALGALAACGAAEPRIRVVTTISPLHDWARVVGGDRVEAVQLLPPGVEAHTFAPTPRDAARLRKADLFLFCGPVMEPWAADFATGSGLAERNLFRAESHVTALPATPAATADPHEHGPACLHGPADGDPHFWLDPLAAIDVVRALAEAFATVDSDGAADYRERAEAYIGELRRLHTDFEAMVRAAATRTVVHGGHQAFGRFARRYGIEFVSPYEGFSPDAQPGPRALAAMIRRMRNLGTRIVYHEELIEPRVARVLAEETGARLVLLHGGHNLTADERRAGATYLSLQRANLERLREGLGSK
ncbi:MAG: metal ABC transporter substrate-binding protein [Verrucomicrobia bacterium]|nr:metal ABC transporter substrate-binding protein [Verrucomicrobiota bacterium]